MSPNAQVTLIRPAGDATSSRGLSSALPPDLLEQVRGRIALLSLLMMIAFAIDPFLFFGSWVVARLNAGPLPREFGRDALFYLGDITVVVASAAFSWITRTRRVSVTRLYTLGLLYQIAICFVIALRTFWEYYRDTGMLPNLTWAPAVVILFPLIVPAAPRVVLAASAAAAAMSPLALLLLDVSGTVVANADAYINTIINGAIAVGFACMGAKVVYGLGREVAAARELGSYRLEEKLGQGGMGEVWRARHRLLARPAAIKLIRPSSTVNGHADVPATAMSRFEREAQATARLRSPHTVTLFDFGIADGGAFYYVMELLEGMDADVLVRRFGPIPFERTIHLLGQVCHSLSEAESCGLVHRDIKPANIFLCRNGEDYDFVKVLDFGLVKGLDDAVDPKAQLTRENTIHGTPAFMAPEQALGRSDLDGRVDIYALGCVAYWLLTGQLVFPADTPLAILAHQAQTPPVPPSARTELTIPLQLDRLVLSCLAKDPADRPQTAKELLHKLTEIDGSGAWTPERARDWWKQHEIV
jgi:eukaryotic-like serine/threonine-protein kinase